MNGWKLVPIEPTDEMIIAAADVPEDWPQQHWEAMLAAAPVPPAGDLEVQRYHVQLFKLSGEQQKYAHGALGAVQVVRASEFDRAAAEVTRLTAEVDRWHDLCVERTTERDGLESSEELLRAELAWSENDCRDLMKDRDGLLAEVKRLKELGFIFIDEIQARDIELIKARELIRRASNSDGISPNCPLGKDLAAYLAHNVDESCGQDAEAAKGGA